ncbi:ABC transporter ATP-binding protein [Pollutibacter soli]|uniref:ABC transporter ATP-binding protein n=1 Tax=Pollutibacter soli TaxID=3034157 RepID=UPI003013EF17
MATSISDRIKKFRRNLNLTRTIKLIWSIAPGRTVWAVLFIVIESVLWFGTLYTLKLLIDSVALKGTQGDDFLSNTLKLIFLAGIVSALYNCVKSYSTYLSEYLGAKISQAVDDRIHSHTIKLDLSYYESPEYLDILKRAREAGNIHPFAVVVSLFDLIRNLLMMLAVGSVLITIDWMLMPLLAVFVLPILLVRIKFSDRLYEWQRRQTPLERKSSYLSNLLTGDSSAKEIRAFSLGKYLLDQYTRIRQTLIKDQMKLNKRRTFIEMATMVMVTSAFYAITAYIIFGAMKGSTSVGDIAVFLVIFPQTFTIMQALASAISKLYQGNIYVANIFELFDLQPKLFTPKSTDPIPAEKNLDVEIRNIHFKYPHADAPALSDVSIRLPAGKIVALVGLNGAGKSTFIKLLCRLYDPVQGSITLGGTDIRKFNIDEYRRQISTVFQDFVRYNVTARDCIKYGDIENPLREDEMREAAINSGANEFIERFPNGYDTMMGRVFDEGHEVSIGQWQKLAIARSFYSPSRLIIFDEATSALDAKSESELFQSFRKRIGSRSALVISHRLSTVKHADYIYVMGDKTVVESGTHEELVSIENGVYARLFQTHLEKQIAVESD